tara:strand:- start:5226 stop:5918 length:693 start_codon:yes stop_codon:yes gene_type:complete
MFANLKDYSLVEKKNNLGNASLKQGKKYRKFSNIINKKNLKETHEDNSNFNLKGFLIEGFSGDNVESTLKNVDSIKAKIRNRKNISDDKAVRYKDTDNIPQTITSSNLDTSLKNFVSVINSKGNQGRPELDGTVSSYNNYLNEIDVDLNSLKTSLDSRDTLSERNQEEDELFYKLNEKNTEYRHLKNKDVLHSQLNNAKLTNKSYYIQYIIWLIAATTMGGLVFKRIFQN